MFIEIAIAAALTVTPSDDEHHTVGHNEHHEVAANCKAYAEEHHESADACACLDEVATHHPDHAEEIAAVHHGEDVDHVDASVHDDVKACFAHH